MDGQNLETNGATPSSRKKKLVEEIYLKAFVVCCKVMTALYAVGFLIWYLSAKGLRDASGTPLGADFLNVYAAGLLANRGQAALSYNWIVHSQIEQTVAGYAAPYFGWHYPPLFLFVAALVAFFPYLWAFSLYMIMSFTGYWSVLRTITPRNERALWALAAFPGGFCNLINGQNGFITAALFGAGFLHLEKRPWYAGLAFGLLAYKPQFFILIPLALFIGGYRKAFLSTLITAFGATLLSFVVFGASTWNAFIESTRLTQHIILEQGATGWGKIQSVFSLVRMWGGDVFLAYLLQLIVGLAALAVMTWVWRRQSSLTNRATVLCATLLLTTPYVLDYDLVILSVPLAYLVKQGSISGFRSYEKILFILLWTLPLLARSWGELHILIAPFLLIALVVICILQSKTFHSQIYQA